MNRPHLIEGLGASDTATGLGGGAAASFFAQAYTLGGQTVISYRGTDAAWDAASGWVNGGGAAVTTAHNSPSSPTPPSSCRETANLSPGLDRGVRLMCTDRVVPNH